ncbi:MAG: hypothetical protein LBL48_02640 [Azoarcus sp.]|jgi:hypothetical protein|nr:hypothetical protein [Azoarcus sp.]
MESSPITTVNRWLSIASFAVGKLNPIAGAIVSQFALASQTGATSFAVSNGTGVLEIRGTDLSISAPTLALASKVGAWIAITAVAAGATLGSAALIPVGLAIVAGIAAAGANKTFQDIISDPEFWDSLGNLGTSCTTL